MASPRIIEAQGARRQFLAERVREISRPDFIAQHIRPVLRRETGRPEDWRTTVIQNDGTGAATVRCDTGGADTLFAKLYFDDSGGHSYQALRTLWSDGFGERSRYRVSEPLAFLPEMNLLITRGAEGAPVAAAETEEALAAGAREAARWLANLHRSPLRIGATRYPWDVYHKLTRRLAKAGAAHPQQVDELISMLDRFEELTRDFELRLVQTHGQFRHIHVFLSASVTVIDLDRSRPADPGKDLGEFVHRMRTHRYKETGGASRADGATRAFLAEYMAQCPENVQNLPFYWCYHTLVSLWRYMKQNRPEDPDWERMTEYYLSEFEYAFSRAWM